jgi:3-deoxy-D-manno-octulosonic-acid transferase
VEQIVKECGLIPTRWSELGREKKEWDVLLLDRMGLLSEVYALAEIVVVGGSFADHGGHNILEAAAHKRPIIIGPYVRHFQNVVEGFHHENAILWLSSHPEITSTLSMLLNDREKRDELGEQAGKVLASGRGNAQLYAERVVETMTARARVESHHHSYAEQVS